jgi:uncharacterized damage-inducible protein DinB
MPPPDGERLSFAERFVTWYQYERDCNAKTIRMLESVPQSARGSEQFARSVGKLTHLAMARYMWLNRLGEWERRPDDFFSRLAPLPASADSATRSAYWFPKAPLEELPAIFRGVEEQWTRYLASLTDNDLMRDFEFVGYDGKRRRWRIVDLLTQVFGHACYHRGQIAMLVKELGGEAVDTDYIFWNRPTVLEGNA